MRSTCLGCFPLDGLPPHPNGGKLPFGLVVNTEPGDQPGEHWLALWVGVNGRAEYFDSYGQQPSHPLLLEYMKKHAPNGWGVVINRAIQTPFSTVCGQHCLYFLYQRSRGRQYTAPASDSDVNVFIERKFALDLDLYDTHMIVMQICKEFMM